MSRGKNDKSLRRLEQLERLRQEFESMPLQALLASPRQEYEQVLALVPNPDRINDLNEIPGEKSKAVRSLLFGIFYARLFVPRKKWGVFCLGGVLHKVKGAGVFKFCMEVYKPRQEKTRQLLGLKSTDAPVCHGASIAGALDEVLDASHLHIDCLEDEIASKMPPEPPPHVLNRCNARAADWFTMRG